MDRNPSVTCASIRTRDTPVRKMVSWPQSPASPTTATANIRRIKVSMQRNSRTMARTLGSSRPSRKTLPWRFPMKKLVLSFAILAAAVTAQRGGPPVLDPQQVQDQDTMTWADYHPIPGVDWADPKLAPTKKQFKVALIAIDFPDQPFVITLPKHSDLFGNPQIDPVAREKVAQFYADFYNTPSPVNHGHTINGYWMQQSRGQIGIAKLDAFGPYRMPKNLYQYGLNEYSQQNSAP